MRSHLSPFICRCSALCGSLLPLLTTVQPVPAAPDGPIKVFILAGDENVLENGLVSAPPKKPNAPGTLDNVVTEDSNYGFLKSPDGSWSSRADVMLYDAHPIHNNTEAPSQPVQIGVTGRSGPEKAPCFGVDLMLSHRLGEAFDEPVWIIRYGVKHNTWFKRGSRDLAHDFRPPSSGGGSDLDGSWDVIHFNFGVWDATYRDPSSKYFSGYTTTSVADYEKNLRTMVKKMKATGATLIYATVTPVWEGEEGRRNGDEDAYNRVARQVMDEYGVIVNDLNAESYRQGFPKTQNVHSVGNLAPRTTEVIRAALAARKHPTQPLPRVLFIGDSITGSYWPQVQKDLDGEATVFKNPGNGEDTWNGLERIDEWLDLHRYLLNGQEYLELVDGVKKLLGEEVERAYPGYAGQPLELAGLFWVHGTADGQWAAKAAEYEKNLAHLIQDLRKDWNTPELPAVVAALAPCKNPNSPNQTAVYQGQLAIGDATKYPAFKDHVRVVDTAPFCRPQQECPGGRDEFMGRAGAYLGIGDALSEAMLGIIQVGVPAE